MLYILSLNKKSHASIHSLITTIKPRGRHVAILNVSQNELHKSTVVWTATSAAVHRVALISLNRH